MIGIGRRTLMLRLALGLAALTIGCSMAQEATGPVVLELRGRKLGLDEIRWAYDHQNAPGAFDAATAAQRSDFLTTVGDKEILLAYAREKDATMPAPILTELRNTDETALLKKLERKVVAPIEHDSLAVYYLNRFYRQLHLMIFITPSDSIAKIARAEVVAGTPFSDVVMKYCKDEQVRERKGDIGWKTPETFGREFSTELWIDERQPGYLSEIRRNPGGVVFYKVLDVRDAGVPENPTVAKLLPELAQGIRSYNGMMAHLDSLRQANGLEMVGESLPVLMKGMNAYWDSLRAASQAAGGTPKFFAPPLWKFSAQERGTTLYKLHGKPVTIAEFLESLKLFPPKQWPMGNDMEMVRQQVDYRIIWQLQLDEVHALGLDRTLDSVLSARTEEEKLRLGYFVANSVSKDITITPEAMRAYYDQNLARYHTKELIQFSYVIFPTKAEAERFAAEANKRDLDWWGDQLQQFIKKRPDVYVKLNSKQFDPSQEVPDTLRAAVRAAWDSHAGQVNPAQPTVGGHWIVPRTTFRQHEGTMPYEKVTASVEATLKDAELNRRIVKLVEDGKKKFGLKLYPERLEKKG